MNPTYFDIALSLPESDRQCIMAAIDASTPKGTDPGGVIAQPYIDNTGVLRLKGAALQRKAAVSVKAAISTSK